MTVNAFHKDFIKTYHPEFFDGLVKQNLLNVSSTQMAAYVTKKRKTEPAHGTIHGIAKPLHMNRASSYNSINRDGLTPKQRIELAPKEFKIYSRAGTANVTPKGKKNG